MNGKPSSTELWLWLLCYGNIGQILSCPKLDSTCGRQIWWSGHAAPHRIPLHFHSLICSGSDSHRGPEAKKQNASCLQQRISKTIQLLLERKCHGPATRAWSTNLGRANCWAQIELSVQNFAAANQLPYSRCQLISFHIDSISHHCHVVLFIVSLCYTFSCVNKRHI